jgi:hypothetical protein
MKILRKLEAVAIVLAACGCTAHSGAGMGADVKAQAAAATSNAPKAAAPTANEKMSNEIDKAVLGGDLEEAAAIVERARRASPPARPSERAIAYYDATVHAYKGDYRGAAKIMYDHIVKVGSTTLDAFSFHDAMIALRTADGDLLGALVECEEMVKAGALGTWKLSDIDRMTLVRLKEHWHRAYLLRMIAQTLEGAERQAFIAYAESARQEYVALAAPRGTLRDSIAVLDAYFAFCDGHRAKMREAALRVNVAEDDDIEDLYLVQLALDGAGDSEAAAMVRKRMFALQSATVLTPVFLTWMRADEAATERHQFSPKFPTGGRPAH